MGNSQPGYAPGYAGYGDKNYANPVPGARPCECEKRPAYMLTRRNTSYNVYSRASPYRGAVMTAGFTLVVVGPVLFILALLKFSESYDKQLILYIIGGVFIAVGLILFICGCQSHMLERHYSQVPAGDMQPQPNVPGTETAQHSPGDPEHPANHLYRSNSHHEPAETNYLAQPYGSGGCGSVNVSYKFVPAGATQRIATQPNPSGAPPPYSSDPTEKE